MALTGLDVFKLLPKTNCGDCRIPTCLGFAMQVASGKASYTLCPHLSQEAKDRLAAASEPPVRRVNLGSAGTGVVTGGETVLFRHEKRFVNQPPVFVDIPSAGPAGQIGKDEAGRQEGPVTPVEVQVARVASLRFERVGQAYTTEGVVLHPVTTGEVEEGLIIAGCHGLIPFFEVPDLATLLPLQCELGKAGALVGPVTSDRQFEAAAMLDKAGCAVTLRAGDLDAMSALVEAAQRKGQSRLLLEFDCQSYADTLLCLVQARRLALRKAYRPFGYPALVRVGNSRGAPGTQGAPGAHDVLLAASLIGHYAGALVVPALPPEDMLALLTWRHDLYSDPERPVQVESQIYRAGDPGRAAPLYITTNFSLTYYSVENEVQASRIPAYILPVDTGGTSVLTAWAAGKFGAEHVAQAIERTGAAGILDAKVAVIPGYVPTMAPKLQELTGWKVLIGPQEASGIPAFARKRFSRDA